MGQHYSIHYPEDMVDGTALEPCFYPLNGNVIILSEKQFSNTQGT